MENKNKLDKSNLRQVILDFPDQFKVGFELAKNIKIAGDFKSICVSGMGGSSLPADMLEVYIGYLAKKYSGNKNVEVIINRTYSLPSKAYDNCLNIFISYSGNTEETLSALNEAIEKKLPLIGIANGGKLKEICLEKNIPFIEAPAVSQPRYALGYFLSILLQILANHNLVENSFEEISDSIEKLKKDTAELEEKGKKLAEKIKNKTLIIHTTDTMKVVGRIWKIKINENACTPCFYNYYPELNHNEMVGYTLPQAEFYLLALRDPKDNPRITQRMELTSELLKKKGIETDIVDVPNNENFFLKIFSSLALADWMSYYLALEYGQDPTPVDMVEEFKKMLK